MYDYYKNDWIGFNVCIFFLYVFDIIVKFNTQIYDNGIILKKKRDIAYKYY